jgi:hypothetical protein
LPDRRDLVLEFLARKSVFERREFDGWSGCARLVVSKILNHVETGVTAIYDRHSYDLEKRAALDFWGKRLDQIISGKRSRVLAFVPRG